MINANLTVAYTSAFLLAFASLASAHDLLFDRGLPDKNLNLEADEKRSNVVWGADDEDYFHLVGDYLVGDDFRLPGKHSYKVTTIRVWTVLPFDPDGTPPADLELWGGPDDDPTLIKKIDIDFQATPAAYPNAEPVYEGYEGGLYNLFQVDFTVDLSIEGGELYDFFLASKPKTSDPSPYLHASNKKRSGTKQERADDLILFFDTDADKIFAYATSEPLGSSDPAWDKDSDVNVQVFGTSDKKKSKPNK